MILYHINYKTFVKALYDLPIRISSYLRMRTFNMAR